MIKTIYTIPAPDSLAAMIEVYGGRTVRDTGTEGHSAFQGRQYGQAEIEAERARNRELSRNSRGYDGPSFGR